MMTDLENIVQLGRSALIHLFAGFPKERQAEIENSVNRFIAVLDRTMGHRKYNSLPAEAIAIGRSIAAAFHGNENLWGAVLLGTLIVQAPDRFASRRIPPEITKEFYDQLQRIALALNAGLINHMTLDKDIFLKELGICRLDIFPCAAQIVVMNSGIPRRLALGHGVWQFLHMAKLATLSGLKFFPFFEFHTHTPLIIKNFNLKGWDRSYHMVAQLLRLYPDYQGVVGGSWLLDPELERVAPHLTYIRQRPQEGGAIFLRVGTSQADVLNATANSPIRRKLYEEKRFVPTGYFLIWPREKLLAWSERNAGSGTMDVKGG